MLRFLEFFGLDLDNNEFINYRNTLIRMLFDRWQHCRQISNTAKNIFNHSSMTETNHQTFIHDIYTLISNTNYLTSFIQQNNSIMVERIFFFYWGKLFMYRLLGIKFAVD